MEEIRKTVVQSGSGVGRLSRLNVPGPSVGPQIPIVDLASMIYLDRRPGIDRRRGYPTRYAVVREPENGRLSRSDLPVAVLAQRKKPGVGFEPEPDVLASLRAPGRARIPPFALRAH